MAEAEGGAPPTHVYGRKGGRPAAGTPMVNSTSQSACAWSRALSPFHLGPVTVRLREEEPPVRAENVENGWQYSKVYQDQTLGEDAGRAPSPAHAAWALAGFANPQAVRFPRGRGARPLYSYHRGRQLPYAAARLYIDVPLYVGALFGTPRGRAAFCRLRAEHAAARAGGRQLAIFDFDGYDPRRLFPGIAGAELFARVLTHASGQESL